MRNHLPSFTRYNRRKSLSVSCACLRTLPGGDNCYRPREMVCQHRGDKSSTFRQSPIILLVTHGSRCNTIDICRVRSPRRRALLLSKDCL
ncbi:hypothetical protein Plhal703r1_c05g0030571 [Plasmopara halstedii]